MKNFTSNFIKCYIKPFFEILLPKFLKNNFEISSTKKSKITGIVFTAILMLAVIADSGQFISLTFRKKWLLLAVAMLLPIVIGSAVAYSIKIKNDVANKVLHFVLLFVMPFLTITMTECLNGIFIYDMTYLGFIANYLLVLLLEFFVFAVSGSIKVPILTVNPLLYGFALAHCFVVEFRGTPFIPMDFLSITTAANVASTYSYKITYKIMIALLLFILIMVIGVKCKTPKYNIFTKIVSRTFTGAFFAILMSLFYFTSVFADAGVKPDFWNQSRGYKNYGFAFSFFCNTKYLYMSEPNGYDPDKVGGYVENTLNNSTQTSESVPVTETTPNIICIMNESLSDLKVLGDFTTNEDYMPFLRSLTENTVRGNLYVPVIGAGTSNTEFEFLTGHSTAFLPSGSNAYMLYVKNPIATLVSTLEGQGYSSLAFHPYYANGWNRPNVYRFMGFNAFKSLENLLDISLMNDYIENSGKPDYLQELISEYYPDRNMLLRQYVSDSYNYKIVIEDYEKRDKSVPYFVFNVTMQNHGGYTMSCSNFNETISLTSADKEYPKTNRYLSLVKESDKAFEELINYFKKVKEPTVICMFGDHQPSIETEFVAKTIGVNDLSNLTIEQEQSRHITPFVIWANYDIEEKQIDKLSSNYLSSLLMKTARVKLTEYNKYLLKLSEQLPVIDTVGYIDASDNYYKWSDSSSYADILDEYEKIQYNNIFDTKNKNSSIFYLEGYVPETVTEEAKK
ncbi:MAG: LTA synthase family protein [Clostridia bacterium]|nr:LTA synthase family protein [Clostridia bacterium]